MSRDTELLELPHLPFAENPVELSDVGAHLVALANQTSESFDAAQTFARLYERDERLAAGPRTKRVAHQIGSQALQIVLWPTPFEAPRQKLLEAQRSLRAGGAAELFSEQPFAVDDELGRCLGAYDPDALGALTALARAGHRMQWRILKHTPQETLDAVGAIDATQGGLDHWLAPLIMLGKEHGQPTISHEDTVPIIEEYDAIEARFRERTPEGTLQRHVGEAALASERRKATDFDAALEAIMSCAGTALELQVTGRLTDDDRAQHNQASEALAALSKIWAIHQISEDYATQELESPKRFIRAALGMVALTTCLKDTPDVPAWIYELLGGFGDDLVASIPFFAQLHRQLTRKIVTKKQVAGQYGIAAGAAVGAGAAATQIDPLATKGTALGYGGSGAAFAADAVGIALTMNLATAALSAKEFSLDTDYKLHDHLPVSTETRQAVQHLPIEDAKELIIRRAQVGGALEPAILAAIERKLSRAHSSEELDALIKPIPLKRLRALKNEIAANAFQRLMLASQAGAVGLDVALAPLVRHTPELLTPLGAIEMIFLLSAARLRKMPYFAHRKFQKTAKAVHKKNPLSPDYNTANAA